MLIALFWENPIDHRRLEPMLRQAGYEVVATDDSGYFSDILMLVEVDLLLLEVASADAPAVRLLRAIRGESLSDVPAIILSEIDDIAIGAAARNLHARVRMKNKNWIPNLVSTLDSRKPPIGRPMLQYFRA